jgi:hypothetical protein
MYDKIIKALSRLVAAIGVLFISFRNGVLSERLKHAENTIDAVEKANKARRRVRTLSDADKLRELREGGYVRDYDADNGK